MKIQNIRKLINNERGNVLVLVALSFIALLGMSGFVLDGGLLYFKKTELQKTANAAVLSGAQMLTNKEDAVNLIVSDILKAHHEESSLDDIQVIKDDRVSLNLKKPVKLTFSRIFGFDTIEVKVHAAAGLRPLGRARGAAPLGIDERTVIDYNQLYSLKVDSSDNISGNFGILALGGPGAKTYGENLRYGYQEELKVGDVVNTQTGNIAGATRTAIQERVNACPDSSENIYNRNCSRVILVLVYKRLQSDGSKLESVQVTGFAYFYITDPMSSKDDSIRGKFIKLAGPGFEEEGSVARGAYKIRLTE